MSDMVNHPPHYNSHPSGIEQIEITGHMNFCLGNAVKYIWRCDEKGKPIEDLQKAIFYLNWEIKRRNGESEEKGTRESDEREYPPRNDALDSLRWVIKAYNEKGSLLDSEHFIQHNKIR